MIFITKQTKFQINDLQLFIFAFDGGVQYDYDSKIEKKVFEGKDLHE